jgi:hypothetical protein
MIRKRFRAVIDVDVEIDEFVEDSLARRAREYADAKSKRVEWLQTESPSASPRHIDAHQQLLSAVLTDPALLDHWAKTEVIMHLNDSGIEEAYEFPADDLEASLLPVIERLPQDAGTVFLEATKRGDLIEELDDFFGSFNARVQHVWVAEIHGEQ